MKNINEVKEKLLNIERFDIDPQFNGELNNDEPKIRYVRPKENMDHIYLSKEKEYKTSTTLVFGFFQITNDRGVTDYYAQNLFQGYN